ncbi:helix-turn-helix transcriptional regulator [Streptomyces montanisoli]|uniref:DUF2791 family P-loop domain-containing protein n=1 Tax=Streptomyces montanisoli TaxID=2798581 RepID=A0A940MB69_9ACTN|nr:helix-turn-helix transcriptional regulator [Streptomyces montanisoli]MBP0457708.1 DUF2791 family P-loop domain-containing protein [Streptomyces montanisoli]
MLGPVESRSVSPVFVGRAREMAALRQALADAAAGEPQAVLVGGEAGVGKTRLVEELADAACERDAIVVTGGCVEIGAEGLPFAPFSTALRSLRRRLPDELAAAADGQENELSRILPELGTPLPDALEQDGTARLFELTARLLERVAADRTVVLVIEDLHWADASTRHLLAYLFRALRRGRLLVIATYRSDDIHRRHPLRPLLAELDRLRSLRHVDLERFTRAEVRRQLTGIRAAEPDAALVDRIFRRSDGNAFFVEELSCSYDEGCASGMTDSLRDLLLVRVERLPEDTQRVVRVAAEGGTTVEYPLLLAVAGLAEDDLIAALRLAVGANVLLPTADGDGYRFRHSLVREAVSDDLLPGERSRLNRRYAQALEADPSLVRADERTTRLASHWYSAHDRAKALPAVLLAAVEARRRSAHAERLRLLERALELWDETPDEVRAGLRPIDRVDVYPACGTAADGSHADGHPDGHPDTPAGPLRHIDLLAEIVVAARLSGDRERALAVAKKALRVLEDEGDALRSAWFWLQRSNLVQDLDRGDGRHELGVAQELTRGLPPSAVHAEVHSRSATWGALHRPGPEALAAADRAVEYARLVGAGYTELQARLTRGWLVADAGGVEEGLAEMYEVRERAEALGATELTGRVATNLPSTLESVGRSQEAVAAAEAGIEATRSLGLAHQEAWTRANMARSLFSLGRWDEMAALLDAVGEDGDTAKVRGTFATHRAELALARGDLDEARRQVDRARAGFGTHDPQPQHFIQPARLAMTVAGRRGDIAAARAEFERVAAGGFGLGMQRYALPLLVAAAAIEADHRGRPEAEDGRAAVLEAIGAHAKRMPTAVPVWEAYALMLEAERARACGDPAPRLWARTTHAFTELSRPYELARARMRWAGALLESHADREEVAALLGEAHTTATALGARPLAEDVALLASRARITLGAPGAAAHAPDSPGLSLGLTPREHDVLRLVADGLSNRRIAEELYISPKTASVHVSNILAKLGVAGRTEAAATAHRLGLFT